MSLCALRAAEAAAMLRPPERPVAPAAAQPSSPGPMPTYDYQCRSCGAITEVIHSMTDDGPSTCERCGGPLRRVLYPTGIIFKGSGFYATDSRSRTGTANPSSGTASSGEAAGSAGSEAGASKESTGEGKAQAERA